MQDGDQDTKFFHNKASNYKRRNKILRLKNQQGVWVLDEGDIANILRSYFIYIFITYNPYSFDDVLDSVNTCLSLDMIYHLTKEFSYEKVKEALD